MKTFAKVAVALLLAALLLAPALAQTDALEIFDVDYDDSVAPGETVVLDFTLAANADVKNIVVKAAMDSVDDTTSELKLSKISEGGSREHLRLKVAVPSDLRPGFYTLTLDAEGRSNGRVHAEQWAGNLEVEQLEHSLWIEGVTPSQDTVTAGNSLDVAITLLNNGKNAEDSVRVKVELLELGVSQTVKLMNTVFQEDEFTTYVTLNVPRDAESGIYTLKATVSNVDVNTSAKALLVVNEAPKEKVVPTRLAAPRQAMPVLRFGAGNVVDVAVSNNQESEATFSLQLSGVSDWTSAARVDPTTLTLGAGESQTVHVYLLPTARGDQSFTLFVKDGSATVSATDVKARVDGIAAPASKTTTLPGLSTEGLVAAFVALIIIVAIAAGVWAYASGKGKGQVYY